MNPVLSVIIPVYNVKPYLRRCLQSVCNQRYPALEIICVDDGSTDGSADIIDEFAQNDSRIIVIRQKNQGLAAARNAAIAIATGSWITGVDSDDYLEPGIYEKAIKYTRDNDLVCFDAMRVTDSGQVISRMSEPVPYQQSITDKNMLFQLASVAFWNKIWKADIIHRAKIDFPAGLWYEDAAFFYKYLAFVNKAIFIPEIGYNYVKRQGSIVSLSARMISRKQDYIKVSKDVYDFYLRHNLVSQHKDALLWIWRRNYFFAESKLTTSHLSNLKKYTRETLQNLPGESQFLSSGMADLLKTYPRWLSCFYSCTSSRKVFKFLFIPIIAIKKTPENKLNGYEQRSLYSLKILGIPTIKISKKSNKCVFKLFGVTLYSGKTNS